MKYNQPDTGNYKGLPQRKSIRLKGYDYSQKGLYFITICTQNRECLFGDIRRGDPCGRPEMILNDAGNMIATEWMNLKNRFPNIELHEFVTMPNHFHGILEILGATLSVNQMGATTRVAPTDKTVGDMTGAFKSITTVEYIRGVKTLGWQPFNGKLWQRNYWEHIIRNENEYTRIADYIINNPQNWENDKLKNT